MPTLMACVPVTYDTAARDRHVTMSLVVTDARPRYSPPVDCSNTWMCCGSCEIWPGGPGVMSPARVDMNGNAPVFALCHCSGWRWTPASNSNRLVCGDDQLNDWRSAHG